MSIKQEPEQAVSSPGQAGDIALPEFTRRRRRIDYTPFLLLLPATLFLAIFFLYPMIQSLVIAFQNSQGGFTFDNINTMIKDVNFGDALKYTLLFILAIVPLQVVLALIM